MKASLPHAAVTSRPQTSPRCSQHASEWLGLREHSFREEQSLGITAFGEPWFLAWPQVNTHGTRGVARLTFRGSSEGGTAFPVAALGNSIVFRESSALELPPTWLLSLGAFGETRPSSQLSDLKGRRPEDVS